MAKVKTTNVEVDVENLKSDGALKSDEEEFEEN